MKNIYVKTIVLVMALFIGGVFTLTSNVQAKTITIEELSTEYNNYIKNLGINLDFTSKVNENNKALDFYSENSIVSSFKYGDDYIEFDNRKFVLDENNAGDYMVSAMNIKIISLVMLNVAGYKDLEIKDEDFLKMNDSYEEYGIQLEAEPYNSSGSNENGSWEMSGYVIKYFKMSLDTSKIDKLAVDYGEDYHLRQLKNIVPNLEIKNIDEDSITLAVNVNYIDTSNPDYKVKCNVYRSVTKDENYEKINDEPINCSDITEIVDKNLESNKEYYYKSRIDGVSKYSESLKVVTKEKNSNTTTVTNTTNSKNSANNLIDNPKTGLTLNTFSIIIIIVASLFILTYLTKNKVLKKI